MKKLLAMSVIGLGLAMFTACNKDKTEGPDISLGDGNVQIKVFDANNNARAYNDTEPAVAGEIELATELSVFVYNDAGILKYENLSLPVNPSTGLTNSFKLSEGFKYFYLFSNGQATSPTGTHWDDLEKQIARVRFENDRPIPIAVNEAMTIGTLWRGRGANPENRWDIQGNGYGGNPVQVEMKVGRATAKIRLAGVNKETSPTVSPLKGTFSDAIYRLRAIPERYYVVGQLDDSDRYPPTTGLKYISAVHELGPGSDSIPSDAFVDYTWDGNVAPGNTHFYAVENTTKKIDHVGSNIPNLYYGNTTYVQMRITYLPDASEVFDGANPTQAGGTIAAGQTYWSGLYNGERLIFDTLPTAAGITDVKEYVNGVMYYKFPVRDTRETGTEDQCCVIRNHYYEITVDNILGLGEGTDKVNPQTPIDDEDPDVQVTIKIEPWYKVEQHVNLD
ncbi:MAG: fimbria major subunit [Odoribacter sp.]|nr:fimbria major subunit [Odoribacter sp.]